MFRRSFAAVLPIALLLAVSTLDAAPAPFPRKDPHTIRKAGKYNLLGGRATIDVKVERGAFSFSLAMPTLTVNYIPDPPNTSPDWFVYPQVSGVYIYFGEKEGLGAVRKGPTGRMVYWSLKPRHDDDWREMLSKVPVAVVAQMPSRLRRLATPVGQNRGNRR